MTTIRFQIAASFLNEHNFIGCNDIFTFSLRSIFEYTLREQFLFRYRFKPTSCPIYILPIY